VRRVVVAKLGAGAVGGSGTSTCALADRRRVCEDLIVRRDGRRSTGHVTLTRIMYSEGVVRQRGSDIDLSDVALHQVCVAFDEGVRTGGPLNTNSGGLYLSV
jgi:hypothetical protein